jgi:hypothetical protein
VLLAIRALSTYNSGLVDRIHNHIRKSLHDSDISVVQAAMVLAREFPNVCPFPILPTPPNISKFKGEFVAQDINSILATEASYVSGINQSIVFNALRCLRVLE